jgi:hypothetical protein
MGAFALQTPMHTLVEVRAYAVRDLKSQNVITLDNFIPFIQDEVRWFFHEVGHKGVSK